MKHIKLWKVLAIFVSCILSSSYALAEYSKSFEGYRIFSTNCTVCHGADGLGNGPLADKLGTRPANLANNDRLAQASDQEFFRIIEGTAPHGRVSEDMPKWGLAIPQTEINSLIAYIRYLQSAKHPVAGNPVIGKQVYNNNCVICHGANGKGKGKLTEVYDMAPADHTNADAMNHMSNEKMHSIIYKGSVGAQLMPGWKGILSDREIDDTISYIRLLSAQ